MFVLVSYDVAAGRTERFRRLLSRYLVHEQNSVFCGLLGRPDFQEMKTGLKAELTDADRVLMLVCENRFNVDVLRFGSDEDRVPTDKKSVVL